MAEDIPEERWLKDVRKAAGITQKELASLFGVSVRTVRNWEKGKTTPSLTLAQYRALANRLNLPLDQLPEWFKPKGGT